MAVLLNKMWDGYKFLFYEISDQRTQNWWLMSDPMPVMALLGAYYYFCTSLGPQIMKNRKPFELKQTVMVYNVFQILMSVFLFYEGCVYVFSKEFSFACDPLNYSENPRILRMARAFWWYFFAKLTELLDTVFFVFRKKSRQISTLHLYHHTTMPITAWCGVKYFPGGHGLMIGYINSFIHIIMYGYYLLSGFGPKFQKYLWWKKHVTTMQLIQFAIVFLHNVSVLHRDCDYPKWVNVLISCNSVVFMCLFGRFYYESYIKNKKCTKKDHTEISNERPFNIPKHFYVQ